MMPLVVPASEEKSERRLEETKPSAKFKTEVEWPTQKSADTRSRSLELQLFDCTHADSSKPQSSFVTALMEYGRRSGLDGIQALTITAAVL